MSTTHHVTLSRPVPGTEIRYLEIGDPTAPPLLLLHGSGGAASLGDLPDRLAADHHVIVPSHPGFDQTSRPDTLSGVPALAATYLEFIDQLRLEDVTVAGFSLGGWVTMEIAAQDQNRITKLALVDPIGVAAPGHPITNPALMTAEEALRANYHDPEPFLAAAARATAEQREAQAANLAATALYTAGGLSDPTLPARLAQVTIPVHIVFGESERIVPLATGQAIANALSGPTTQTTIPKAGHRPQLEQPHEVHRIINNFIR